MRFSHLGAQAADNVKESLALMIPCLPGVVYNRPTFPATFFRAICNVAFRCNVNLLEVKYGNGKLCKAKLFSVSSTAWCGKTDVYFSPMRIFCVYVFVLKI